jgi:two-component system, OmpR family, KDP operon response regulator KdpE
MPPRILVVEDEPNIRDLVCLHLGLEGHECVPVADGKEAMALASEKLFDLIILDLMLPGVDGVTITRALRRHGSNRDTPILMLTARREESDKVMGLDSGADDYLTKPFGVEELLARIRVALRHAAMPPGAAPEPIFESGDLKVDLPARRVWRAGEEVHLTPTEYKLLAVLVRNAGKVLTHRQLLKDVWGINYLNQSHYVRVYLAQLRQKIEADPARPRLLLTEPGVGYRLRDE